MYERGYDIYINDRNGYGSGLAAIGYYLKQEFILPVINSLSYQKSLRYIGNYGSGAAMIMVEMDRCMTVDLMLLSQLSRGLVQKAVVWATLEGRFRWYDL